MLYFIIFLLVILVLWFLYNHKKAEKLPITYTPKTLNYWPTKEWQLSTPEAQGMDSAKLIELVKYYEKQHSKNEKIAIDSITIIRNGYIVADLYFNPLFPKDTKHIINSCTKSIVSALIGIAIEKGYIKGIEVKVLDILNDSSIEISNEELKTLRLKDLLTMQTGLRSHDSYLYQWKGLFEMQATDDWTKYILNLPMETTPNLRFDYSNMASFLLSAILKKATGTDTLIFAKEYLFAPLGIKEVQWEKSPKGIDIGWARMWLKPHDMAKIGLLFLQKGQWNNQQIIPAQWVEASITPYSFPKKYRYIFDEKDKVNYVASGGNWLFTKLLKPFSDGYGYQWWLDKSGRYAAVGVGGQFIMVAPKENVVVAVTSKLSGPASFLPAKLFYNYILPAITSNQPIKGKESSQKELAALSEPAKLILAPKPIPTLPSIVPKISGATYLLASNPWRNNHLKLVFTTDKDYATFSYTTKENELVSYEVSLNNVYRLTDCSGNNYAAVGIWATPNQFIINYELIGYSSIGKWTLTFENEEVLVEEVSQSGTYSYQGKKK